MKECFLYRFVSLATSHPFQKKKKRSLGWEISCKVSLFSHKFKKQKTGLIVSLEKRNSKEIRVDYILKTKKAS